MIISGFSFIVAVASFFIPIQYTLPEWFRAAFAATTLLVCIGSMIMMAVESIKK